MHNQGPSTDQDRFKDPGLRGQGDEEKQHRTLGMSSVVEGKPGPRGIYARGWQAFFIKGHIVNVFGFAGHRVSIVAAQLCHCSRRTATDNM